MTLPWMKDKEGSASAPVEKKVMHTQEESEYGTLDACAEDLLMAVEKKDKRLLKAALESLIDHIMSIDEQQDKQMMGG